MNKKLYLPIVLMLAFSMILGACGAPAVATEPPVVVTEPPVIVTEPPVVEVAPDAQALFTELVAGLTSDNGYGTVAAAKLSEEIVDKPAFLLDVREVSELEADGYIEGAVNIPVREVLNNLDKLPGLDESIVIYCASGHRGAFVMSALKLLGYTNVRNLGGGLGSWKKANLPVVTGSMPTAPAAISTPIVADQPLYDMLNGFLTSMPDDFYTVKSDKLAEELTGATLPVIIDVRTADEFSKDGYIEGAVNVPFNDFFANLDKLPAKDQRLVILCASGHRGSIIMMALRLMGYTDVVNLGGGLGAWKTAKLPLEGWVDWATVMGEFVTTLPSDAGFYSIKSDKLNELLVENPPFIVDVREPAEIEQNGYIAGAINIPIRDLLKNLDKLPAQDQKIVITCASGHRGSLGMMALRLLGYTDVVNLNGGMNGWVKAEFPVETGAPAAPVAGTAPEVDATRFAALDAYLSNLPEGFGAIKSPDFNTELTAGNIPFILDVRSQAEWDANGHMEGAVLVPVNDVPANLAQLPTDKAAPILVLCASGHRGAMVQMYLQFLGYTNVRNLNGGMNGWIAAELPVVK